MYPLKPVKVYMLERVKKNPKWVARMNRMLKAIGYDKRKVICINAKNLSKMVHELENLKLPEKLPPKQIKSYTRALLFTTMELREPRPDLTPKLKRCRKGANVGTLENIFGYMTKAQDQHPHKRDQRENMVCWPTYNYGTMRGCPHGCTYCGQNNYITVALNLEEYMDEVVGPCIEKYPWNKVHRMILGGADLVTFEPEYGLFDLFTKKLAEYKDRYGHFHTGSDNLDWVKDLKHKDRLVGVWSTTCETVSKKIEPGSGPAINRIKAALKCQKAGIPVRYKFKPIIPVKNWKKEYAEIIKKALKMTKPESIGFCVMMWMTYEGLKQAVDIKLLDPKYVKAAKDAQEEMAGVRTGPFPHKARAEIYRFFIKEVRRWDKDVLLYLSTESREMWDELKDELGQDPRCYVCGCSSVAVPGGKLALSAKLKYSTYSKKAS